MGSYGSVGRWKQAGSKGQPSDPQTLMVIELAGCSTIPAYSGGALRTPDGVSIVLSGPGVTCYIFCFSSFYTSVKRPARLWDVFADLLISHPQPLRLCEKLRVPNWGGCWALHVSLRPPQKYGHKVSVSGVSWLLGLWEAGLGSAQRIFSSHLPLWSSSYQKRNSASMEVWEGLLWRVWELGGSAICPDLFSQWVCGYDNVSWLSKIARFRQIAMGRIKIPVFKMGAEKWMVENLNPPQKLTYSFCCLISLNPNEAAKQTYAWVGCLQTVSVDLSGPLLSDFNEKSAGEYGHSIPMGIITNACHWLLLGMKEARELLGDSAQGQETPLGILKIVPFCPIHPLPLCLGLSQSLLSGDLYLFLCSRGFGGIVPVWHIKMELDYDPFVFIWKMVFF